jgi:hypothetical protein
MTRPDPQLDDADSPLSRDPPRPKLTPEWRLVLILSNGYEHVVPVDSQAEAEWKGSRLGNAVWRVDHRLVTAWQAVGATRRTRTVIEEVDPGSDNGKQRE